MFDDVCYGGQRNDHCAEHWTTDGHADDADDDDDDDDGSRWIGAHDLGT